MKTLGLIGGLSWESTATYYRLINEGVKQRVGGLSSAKLVLTSMNFADVAALQQKGAWDDMTHLMQAEARKLEAAGCDTILICTNTMHKLYEPVQEAVSIPILHICDVIGKHAQRAGIMHLALTGTKFTMEENFYVDWLTQRYGLKITIPNLEERDEIHRIIFESLCKGMVKSDEVIWFAKLNEKLIAQGCEAVILGCTELAMLVSSENPTLPLLDTTTLHAEAAVDFSLGV